MNDDALTPPAELASAALDGHTTADERATVAASAALRDEMAFYGGLRDQLAAVEVPLSARESALAAALAVFDEIQADATADDAPSDGDDWTDARSATSPPPTAAPVAPIISLHERRKRQYRWLGGAAAAAIAFVVAVGVINGGSSDDGSDTASIEQRATTDDSSAKTGVADSGLPSAAYDVSADTTAETMSGAATEAADSAADSEPMAEPATTTASPDLWVGVQQLDGRDDVVEFADSLPSLAFASAPETSIEQTEQTTAASTSASIAESAESDTDGGGDPFACVSRFGTPFAPAIFQDRKVFVVDDVANAAVLIVDPVDCSLIQSFDR